MKRSETIDWENLTGNSSEEDALCKFARGEINFAELCRQMWSPGAKTEIAKLKRKSAKQARTTIKRGLGPKGHIDWE